MTALINKIETLYEILTELEKNKGSLFQLLPKSEEPTMDPEIMNLEIVLDNLDEQIKSLYWIVGYWESYEMINPSQEYGKSVKNKKGKLSLVKTRPE